MKNPLALIAGAYFLLINVTEAIALDKICSNKTTGIIALRPKCKKSETPIKLRSELVGPAGTNGEDGSLSVYGDGSSGALLVASDLNWNSTQEGSTNNRQFTSCTISSGVTFTVSSGTVIRCTGDFVNQGTIVVVNGASGGRADRSSSGERITETMNSAPHPGITRRAAGSGELIFATGADDTLAGGIGGDGLGSLSQAAGVVMPGLWGGGGGAAVAADGSAATGGTGGGSLVIIAKGAVILSGLIQADGESVSADGCGGGGGGVVVIASNTSIAFSGSGSVSVKGGGGGPSSVSHGAGAGGGGGIVHYIAPSIPFTIDAANTVITEGARGDDTVNVAIFPRQGGAGGGGSGNVGGSGGIVLDNGTADSPGNASPGRSVISQVDPTSLF